MRKAQIHWVSIRVYSNLMTTTTTERKIRLDVEALEEDLKHAIEVCLMQKQSVTEVLELTDNLRESALSFRKTVPRKRHRWARMKKRVFIIISGNVLFILLLAGKMKNVSRC